MKYFVNAFKSAMQERQIDREIKSLSKHYRLTKQQTKYFLNSDVRDAYIYIIQSAENEIDKLIEDYFPEQTKIEYESFFNDRLMLWDKRPKQK